MTSRIFMLAILWVCSGGTYAQSADQEVLSVTDSADPVVPGQNVSYTIVVRNNGPDAAVNGGLNVNLGSALVYVSHTIPAGWQCFFFGNSISCLTPSFAAGTTETITLVAQMAPHLINFPDGSTSSNFSPSGTTPDPNNGNNFKSESTAWDSPQMDLAIAVTDTPDPIGPDQDLSYTVTTTNSGPDAASAVNFNVYNAGFLPFRSVLPPAGWTCAPPAVGGAAIFTCSTPTFAAGATHVFTVVVRADDAVLGINDGSVSTSFTVNGTGDDTNDNNNAEVESTAYVTPDADLAITVDDLPDPVLLGQDIEYLVTMDNNGPDAATNATMNVYNNGSLRFQSIDAPLDFTCTLPQVGSAPILSCSAPSMASGASVEFILTVRTDPQLIGTPGGTVMTSFSAGSGISDPVQGNEAEVESTLVRAVQLFMDSFEQ